MSFYQNYNLIEHKTRTTITTCIPVIFAAVALVSINAFAEPIEDLRKKAGASLSFNVDKKH